MELYPIACAYSSREHLRLIKSGALFLAHWQCTSSDIKNVAAKLSKMSSNYAQQNINMICHRIHYVMLLNINANIFPIIARSRAQVCGIACQMRMLLLFAILAKEHPGTDFLKIHFQTN